MRSLFFSVDSPGPPITQYNNQTWFALSPVNQSFYQMHPRSTFTSPQIQFDSSPYAQPLMFEERPVKKVQFAPPHQPLVREPLATTQSWHESSTTRHTVPVSMSRSEPLSARRSMASTLPNPAEKSIYIHIDHKATLALRSQTAVVPQTRKNVEKNNGSDVAVTSTTHRIRSSRDSTNASVSSVGVKPRQAYNSLQAAFSGSYHPGITDKVMHVASSHDLKLFKHRARAAQPGSKHNIVTSIPPSRDEQHSSESASTRTPITRLRISHSTRSRHKSSLTPTSVTTHS